MQFVNKHESAAKGFTILMCDKYDSFDTKSYCIKRYFIIVSKAFILTLFYYFQITLQTEIVHAINKKTFKII